MEAVPLEQALCRQASLGPCLAWAEWLGSCSGNCLEGHMSPRPLAAPIPWLKTLAWLPSIISGGPFSRLHLCRNGIPETQLSGAQFSQGRGSQ